MKLIEGQRVVRPPAEELDLYMNYDEYEGVDETLDSESVSEEIQDPEEVSQSFEQEENSFGDGLEDHASDESDS